MSEQPTGLAEGEDAAVVVVVEEKFVPEFCHYRLLCPITAIFKVHRTAHGTRGEIPLLTHAQWATFFVCCFCHFLNAYDWELYPVTLKQFQRELNISETEIGLISGAVRLGNILSLPTLLLADLYGRKRLMLASSLFYLCFVSACGLSQAAWVFTLLQVLARAFMAAQSTLSATMLVESLNAVDRGWGIGSYNALGVLGAMLALAVFAMVGDLPGAWRGLYMSSGFLFLPFLFVAARKLPESERFLAVSQKRPSYKDAALVPLRKRLTCLQLVQSEMYRLRLFICCLASALNGFAFAPSETFKIKKLLEVHGLTSAHVGVIQIVTGFVAFASFTLAGSMSDRYGRKPFLVVFNSTCALGAAGFFIAPSDWGALVYLMNFIQVLSGFVLRTVKLAYFAELFSTSNRALAQGWFVVFEFSFGAIALAVESALFSVFGEHWMGCAILSLFALISSALILVFLPEVSSKELEEISPDDEEEKKNGVDGGGIALQ